jgi:Kef-type K+ transport system membrane component KefB
MTPMGGICLLLLSAHALGWVAERMRQPALLGHMLAGIVVGPSMFSWITPSASLSSMSDLAVAFVVMTAGLEMRMQQVLDTMRGRGFIALLHGFAIPAAAAALFSYGMGLGLVPTLVVVLCVSVTALPVALRILSEFGMLNTDVARVAIASALLADLVVLMVLGITIALGNPAGAASPVMTATKAVVNLGALLLLVTACYFVCARLSAARRAAPASKARPSFSKVAILVFLFVLGLGAASEQLGFHFAIGMFLAALLVTPELIGEARFASLVRACELMALCVFAPLFLAYQGTQFQVGALDDAVFVIGLLAVAIVSKMVSGYVVARVQSLSHRTALGVAVIMNARGLMEMVTASIAYRAGLITQELFSALLILGIVTTLITPPLLRHWIQQERPKGAQLTPPDYERQLEGREAYRSPRESAETERA